MATPRFFLSPDDLNTFEADRWARDQNHKLADQWAEQALGQLNSGIGAPQPQSVPDSPAATPAAPAPELPPLDAATQSTAQPLPTQSPSMPADAPVLDLSKPAPVSPEAPLPQPSRVPPTSPVRSAAALPTGGLVDYARQAAQKAGIDPDLFVRQINQESGFATDRASPAGAQGIAQIVPKFHPGVDVTDPYVSLDYAANLMAGHLKTYGGDIRKALVAYNGGGGAVQAMDSGRPYAESQDYLNKILGGSTDQTAATTSLSQFGDKTISADEAYAACGPAAASRLAALYGNNIPLSVALQAAKSVGWTTQGGMNGIQNEKRLMDALNLPAELDTSGNWSRIVAEAGAGKMVTISTPGHYFSASGARQRGDQTELYVGQSGLDLKGGKAWMTPQEIEQAMGKINGALFSDPSRMVAAGDWMQRATQDHGVQPESPEQTINDLVAAKQKLGSETISNPFGEAFRQVGNVAGQVGGAIGAGFDQLGTRISGGAQQLQAGQEAQTRGVQEIGGGISHALTEEQPWMQNLVKLQSKRMAGETLTPQEEYVLARGMATGLSQTFGPEELTGRAVAAGAGSLAKSAEVAQDVASSVPRRQAAELDLGLVTGHGPTPKLPIPETTPAAVTAPKLAQMAGTAAEQAALRPEEAGRAANILLEKFPAEVRPHLEDVASKFGQFAGQRRGVITDVQAEANAAQVALGMTPEKWIKTPAGKAFNQEQAIALGNTLTQVDKEYDALLTTTQAARAGGTATPEMEVQLADKTLELAALGGVRSGAAAEAGRTLRAFRQALTGGGYANRNKAIDAAFKAIGTDKEKFAQWVEEYSQLADPVAKHKMLQGLQTPSWWDRISLLRYASMLSSTTTHLVNAFGNVINVGLDVALKPVSVGIDVARARVTGGERTRYMGELAPQVKGLIDGAVDGLDKALTTLREGVSPRDLGKFENIRPGFQAGRGTSTIIGAAGGGAAGGLTAPENATLEERLGRIGAGAAAGAAAGFGVGSTQRGLTAIDTTVEMPLRLLSAADNVFRGAAFGANARAAAARKGIQEGLTGDALRTRIQDIMANLPSHPDIAQQADKAAARAVLQESNALASAITGVGRGQGAQNTAARIVREIIVPFAKTPLNIVGQGMEMTPYGLLKVRDLAKAGDVGGATDAAARVAFGSALMVGVGALAANGAVTGGYPADPKERATLPPGWQPWSLRIPNSEGGHTYVSFSQLGPIAVPMAIAAIAGQSVKEGVIADPITLATSLGKFMVDQTFLQGMSAIIDAIKDPKRYGENFTEQIATSFVPYAALSREVTRITGQADRDPKGAVQAIQALIPGAAEGVPRRQDALGRDIHSTQTGIGAAISPAKYSSTKVEPVLTAFRDVGMGIPDAPKEIRIKSQVTGSTSPPMALNEREQNQYQALFGQRLQDRLAPLVSSPDWQRRSVDARKKALEQQIQAARDYAEAQINSKMTPDDRQRRMAEGRAKQLVKPLPAP